MKFSKCILKITHVCEEMLHVLPDKVSSFLNLDCTSKSTEKLLRYRFLGPYLHMLLVIIFRLGPRDLYFKKAPKANSGI